MGTVLLAAPRGFCAGVERAVATVEQALAQYGAPVHVRKQIVHNTHVVERLRLAGAVFVDEVGQVPSGAVLIISAHGASPEVHREAADRDLRVIDATCPLVTKVHREARRFAADGYHILLIGQEGHDEVIGTTGQAPDRTTVISSPLAVASVEVPDTGKVAWLAQTTLAVREAADTAAQLRERFPALLAPPSEDICYAAQNRQTAVQLLAAQADLVLVVGSPGSHNSRSMVEVARAAGTKAHLVEDEHEIEEDWLFGTEVVGLSAGASAPEEQVLAVLSWLRTRGYDEVRTVTAATEEQVFALPRELLTSAARG